MKEDIRNKVFFYYNLREIKFQRIKKIQESPKMDNIIKPFKSLLLKLFKKQKSL